MLDLFSQLIAQLNSSIFILLGMLALCSYVLFKLGEWKNRFFQQDQQLKKIEDMHAKVIELTTKVDLIYVNTNPRSLVSPGSPLALTKFGKEFAETTNSHEIFRKYVDGLMVKLNAACAEDANAYDIQQSALKIAASELPRMLDATEINRFKQAAFDKGILFDDIWPLFGIWLRDQALIARHIPVLDVDRHDPLHSSE